MRRSSSAFMWSSGALYTVRIHTGDLRLRLPLPVFALTDTLKALEEPFALLGPLFGLPNYPALLREILSVASASTDTEPLVDIQTDDVSVRIQKRL